MIKRYMKKIILIIFFSVFLCNPSFSVIKGKGEVKMSDRALNHFMNYIWGNFDVDISSVEAWATRARNPKPGMFIMSSDGEWSSAWYCPYSRCTDPGSSQTVKECERDTGVTCGVFAVRKTIYWDNGINTKTNKAKINSNWTEDQIKFTLVNLGFYEGDTSTSDMNEDLKDLKKLYDDGVITKKEFEKAKKRLLN